MALPNARNQYLKTQIETASKEQLVVMLFDGVIRFTEQARKAIEEKQIEDSHHALMRAQAIVMELICTVDKEKGGEVANNLMGLHAYAFNCLIVCNMKKDIGKIDEVQKIYRQLREGWVGAMENLGIAPTMAKASAAPAAPPAGRPAAPSAGANSGSIVPPIQPKPPVGPGSNGIMASAKPAAPVAGIAPAIQTAPKIGGYGMGKTAMIAGLSNAAHAVQPGKPVVTAASAGAKPAVVNAYQGGTRSIA